MTDYKALIEKDKKNVWHAMRRYNPDGSSIIMEKADGVWLTDVTGEKYLDAMAGLWCVNVGYGRDELAEAAYEQLKTMPYYPMTQSNIPAIKLSEKLDEWLGGDYVYFFSNSGSEANETAFKIARQYHVHKGDHTRHKFISRYRAYHGNTFAALAATGQAQRKIMYEPLAPGFIHVTPPDIYRSPYQGTLEEQSLSAANEIDRTMRWEVKETIAAVIMEPIITGGGVIIPHESYLPRVKEICEENGALLILDEVICGFGRTGEKFGFQNYGVQPDIITMAKGITSGYLPLSVTAVRREIYDAFAGTEDYDHFRHVNTFGGNAAACALALKNMEIFEKENLVERSKEMGAKLLEKLADLNDNPYVGHVRGKGLLVGIELVENKETKEPAKVERLAKVVGYCKDNGVLVGSNMDTVDGFNNIFALSPPLNISEEEMDHLVKVVKEAFATLV